STGESNFGAYPGCLIDGRPRVDLKGEVVGRVTFDEHAEAVRLKHKVERETYTDFQLARFAREGREWQRRRLNVIVGGMSHDEPHTPKKFDELLTAAARLTLRLALAAQDYDDVSIHDHTNGIANLMAAYVNSEQGKKFADRPDLLLTRVVSVIATIIVGD